MAKPELGSKRLCASCGAKFYDLNKTPIAYWWVAQPECRRSPRRRLRVLWAGSRASALAVLRLSTNWNFVGCVGNRATPPSIQPILAALAPRGIAMAQLGDLVRAKALVQSAARAFGPKEVAVE